MHLDPKTRGRTTDEALEIIHRLWSGEKLDYDGRHFKLTGASISPVPVQADLPMWIGGSSEAAVRRTAKYGTGWQAGAETPEAVGRVIADIKTALAGGRRTSTRIITARAWRTGSAGRTIPAWQGDGGVNQAHRP